MSNMISHSGPTEADAHGSPRLRAVDPRSGVVVGEVAASTARDVREAVHAAVEAVHAQAFANPDRRARLLATAATGLRRGGPDLVALVEAETGLARPRLEGELERTAGQLEMFSEMLHHGDHLEPVIDTADPDARPIPRPDVRRMLAPVGPVAVFGAGNFPLAFGVAGGDTASAVAAGCPVVVKGHPSHPGTNQRVFEILRSAADAAGLPDGAVGLVQSDSVPVAEMLVDEPSIEAIAFTGSLRAGRSIFDRAARRERPIPVFAEMGSVNPLVLTDAALRRRGETIADALSAAVTGSAGQLCTKPGVVLVPAGAAGDDFIAAVVARLESSVPVTMLDERLRDGLTASVAPLRRASTVTELTSARSPGGQGFVVAPTAFRAGVEAVSATPALLEEHFGPVVVLLVYTSDQELHDVLGQLPGQLTATLHSEASDLETVRGYLPRLRELAGRVIFDGMPSGVSVCSAMHHGGPYPATTAPQSTSVGTAAVQRFLRPVAYQDCPPALLPDALSDHNPLGLWRRVNGQPTRAPIDAPMAPSAS